MSSTFVAYAPEVERVLAGKTLREPGALSACLAAVRHAGRDEAQFTPERLHELVALAEHFQSLLLYDQLDFLRAPGTPEAEREFAVAVQRVCLEAANGFQRFLRSRDSWAASPGGAGEVLRVIGLALDAIHGAMKWGYFLGEPARTAPWRQLHALYALADVEGMARTPFQLHAALPSYQPTVESLYLHTLVMDLLNAGNLTRVQIEVADGWFSSWCQEYALEGEHVPGKHLFYVDFGSAGGMRLMRGETPGETARYLQAEKLKAQIEDVQSGLRHGRLYAGYGAGALFPVEEHVALLATIEKLYQSVLSGSEGRIEERTHFEDREVDVVVGSERVMRKVREGAPRRGATGSGATSELTQTIELSAEGLSLVAAGPGPDDAPQAQDDPELERWRVHDLSSNGYGLIVDQHGSEAIMLNGLIALLNQETGGWILGSVVRKRPSRVHGEILVGIEVLAYRPVPVDLDPGGAGGAPTQALYLPGTDTSGKLDSLVVRAGEFDSHRLFSIRVAETQFKVRMNRIIRKGGDWINARFEVESKK